MPRQARKQSGTGIYHVMLRGINRQDIFEGQEDYARFLTCMQQMLQPLDDLGNPQPPLCTFYAYCLMSNHVHLLLKVGKEDIGSTIKRLALMYALYFNRKYSRAGHLFQDRFKSEPVNDIEYFVTLLRYIHQNPLKAGMVEKAGDYQWSSWPEYTGDVPSALGLCATNVVTKRLGFDHLRELIETPLSDTVQILDIEDNPRITTGDHEIRQLLEVTYGISEPLKVQELDKEKRNEILLAALDLGAGLRQLSRLTGVTYGVIHRLSYTRQTDQK
jgi:REP element-mobilizing transposase RayT